MDEEVEDGFVMPSTRPELVDSPDNISLARLYNSTTPKPLLLFNLLPHLNHVISNIPRSRIHHLQTPQKQPSRIRRTDRSRTVTTRIDVP